MASIISPDSFARVVLNRRRTKPNADMGAESIHRDHFAWASIGTVRKAANAAQEQNLVHDASNHNGRRQWVPTARYMLATISDLMAELQALRAEPTEPTEAQRDAATAACMRQQ